MGVKMRSFLILILFASAFGFTYAQKVGELAPEKPIETFPENSWGVDIMFGEGGFGLGTFFRKSLSSKITAFTDISFSETKDDREFEYIDYFGQSFTFGKKNRVFLVPLNFGVQYRLFENVITDNLRPYLNLGAGPTMVITTPYDREFFNSFGKARANYAVGGYVGFGANFGLSKDNLVGLNIRYYYVHLFNEGVESLFDKYRKNFSGIYLTINLGIMY